MLLCILNHLLFDDFLADVVVDIKLVVDIIIIYQCSHLRLHCIDV